MPENEIVRRLQVCLAERQLPSGGWSFRESMQAVLEPTCLALLALDARAPASADRGIRFLLRCQNKDDSWPAFDGADAVGSWATALAVITLNHYPAAASEATRRGLKWILATRGREAQWLWRWKFLTVDRKVRFDPNKFGWPWTPDTIGWVVPTAFCLIAIRQCLKLADSDSANFRIKEGTAMLMDRACPGGGWNAGNAVVYNTTLAPMLDPTAAALLALRGRSDSTIQASLQWLFREAPNCRSAFSLGWSIIALAAHGRPIQPCLDRLMELCAKPDDKLDSATLAVASLAIQVGDGVNAFEVPL